MPPFDEALAEVSDPLSARTAPALIPAPPDIDPINDRIAPKIMPKFLFNYQSSPWSLTKRNVAASTPEEADRLKTSYADASTDPRTGLESIANPSLTKLGKLFTVLRAAGMGAVAGSGQPDFMSGVKAAQQGMVQRAQQRQQLEMGQNALAQQREGLRQMTEMVETPFGVMPMSIAKTLYPAIAKGEYSLDAARIKAEAGENIADTRTQSAQAIAKLNNMSREQIAKYNADSRAKLAGVTGVEVTPEFAKEHNIPIEYVGTKVKLTDLAALQRSTIFEDIPLQTATGPIIVNRKTGQARAVTGPEGQTYLPPALASPKEIADVTQPGQTKLVPGYEAIGQPGAQSASVQVPKAEMKAEVPKDIGVQKVAFNTALQHADLLESAVRALDNSDWQALNRLENRFKNAFGYAGPITAQAIANAYTREVTTMLSKGHMTNSEIESAGSTIDPQSQNLEQVLGVLGAYRALSTSKLKMLEQQAQAAVDKSQPTKKTGAGGGNAPSAKKASKASKYGVEIQ